MSSSPSSEIRMKRLFPLALWSLILFSLALNTSSAQSAPDIPVGSLEDLGKLEKKIQEVIARTRPAVVGIRMSNSSGSGSFISADGWVATAGHVCEIKPDVKCTVIGHNGETYEGVVYGSDMAMDYGLIKVDTKGKKVPYLELGESEKVKNGQWLIAMGHPLGIEKNRDGVVRAGRVLLAKNRQGFITMDAPVIHGDSGGPVVDLGGKQVAINQSINGLDARVNNVTPVELFKKQLDQMKNKEVLHRVNGQPRFGRGVQSDGLSDAEREAYGRAMELHGRKNYKEAGKLVEPFANKKITDPGVLYNLSCIFAMQAVGAKGPEAESLQKKAVELLVKAIEAGWDDLEHTRRDSDLDGLRQRKDYVAAENLLAKASVKSVLGLAVRSSAGIRVSDVIPGSPADRAGLKKDDIIQKIGKARISGPQDYCDALLLTGMPADTEVVVSRKKEKPGPLKLSLPPLGIKVFTSGGAQITEIVEDSVAYRLGLKVGDVITKVDAVKVKSTIEFVNALLCSDARKPAILTFKRGTDVETVEVTFAASEASGAASSSKQDPGLLKLWDKVSARYADAVFSVKQKGKQVAFATAVDGRGYLLSKASEIDATEKIVLLGRGGNSFEAQVVATDSRTDLVLLKAPQVLVSVVKFEGTGPAGEFPAIGTLLGTLDEKGSVLAHGFVALPPYDSDANAKLLPDDAVLGVGVEDVKEGGIRLTTVTAGAPGEKGGLKVGDIIRSIDGREMTTRDAFMALMREKKPGDIISVDLMRDGKPEQLKVTLGARKDLPGGGGAAPQQGPKGTGKPDLGVARVSPANPGVKIERIVDGSSAEVGGLQEGDIILEAGEKPTNSAEELAAAINERKPGDKLKLKISREGKALELEIELAEQEAAPPSGAGTQNKGPVNVRCDKFGSVIQHDALIAPRHMGGPVIDLKGSAVGINLGRSDRTRNFALPAARVVEVLRKLLAEAEAK